jgi:hypothetical protein
MLFTRQLKQNNKSQFPSQLPSPNQIPHHLPPRNPRCPPQRDPIQRARKRICIPEPQHGRDPATRVLERETRAVHLVLLHFAASQVMYAALGVHFGLVRAGRVGELFAADDVEVIVGGVAAGVSFGANGGACESYQ